MSPSAIAIDLPFVEPQTGLAPADRAGGVADLTAPPSLSTPEVVRTDRGFGRLFGDGMGFVGHERAAGQAQLTRDLTIEVLCRPSFADAGDELVLCSGEGGGRMLWGLRLVPRIRNVVTVQMVWDRGSGTEAPVPGRSFAIDGGDQLYLWATRRWGNPNLVEVQYGVNERVLGSATSTDGDIEAAGDGLVTVGCRLDGAGGHEGFFHGVIELVRVSRVVRSPEELRQTYRGIIEHPHVAFTAIQKLMPVGDRVYSTDPDSILQRELNVEGAAIGKVGAKTAELRDDFYPDTAWSKLPDWERLTGQFPAPSERFEPRRNRVLSFLRTQHGFSTEKRISTGPSPRESWRPTQTPWRDGMDRADPRAAFEVAQRGHR